VALHVGEPSVKQGTLLGRNRDILLREGIPQCLNELQPILWAEPKRLRENLRFHVASIPPLPSRASNDQKLSGTRHSDRDLTARR